MGRGGYNTKEIVTAALAHYLGENIHFIDYIFSLLRIASLT